MPKRNSRLVIVRTDSASKCLTLFWADDKRVRVRPLRQWPDNTLGWKEAVMYCKGWNEAATNAWLEGKRK